MIWLNVPKGLVGKILPISGVFLSQKWPFTSKTSPNWGLICGHIFGPVIWEHMVVKLQEHLLLVSSHFAGASPLFTSPWGFALLAS